MAPTPDGRPVRTAMARPTTRPSYSIAMVSDFFYPNPGGIESHMYQLSSKLVDRGHKVIVIVHASTGRRTGIRYLANGLKVYHLPAFVLAREATFPTVFGNFPLLRNIFIREKVEIVHGHASLSNLCHEAMLHGRTMGLRTVFTDHSLFGFAGAADIFTNKLVKFSLSDVDHVVCVSHTGKENTVLRAALDPVVVSVIPNAVVADQFRPLSDAEKQANGGDEGDRSIGPDRMITIVVISRLFPNKGIDLLIGTIPRVLAADKNVRFVIAGSGPKAIDLEQMVERHVLQDRVVMLGTVRHEQVRSVMVQGQIYLHPALIEAFGTVLIEAAACGLLVVTTDVGGIPEVLPPDMTVFATPEVDDLVAATVDAVRAVRQDGLDSARLHDRVCEAYSWHDVARRTERVYDGISGFMPADQFYSAILDEPNPPPSAGVGPGAKYRNRDIFRGFRPTDRLKRYYGCGVWAGKLFCAFVVLDYLFLILLDWWFPRSEIDVAVDWPRKNVLVERDVRADGLTVSSEPKRGQGRTGG